MIPTEHRQGGTRRRLLVVAYYFPPMGLSGVQRVSKFVKYLPEHGWQPTVLTVDPAGYFAFDAGLLAEVESAGIEVLRTTSVDPTRLFGRRTVALPREDRRRRLAWLSHALFVPDNKIGWKRSAVRTGRAWLEANPCDAVWSSAPPYTAHLVGRALARGAGLPLVTDFRDDWVGNPRHVYPTLLHRVVHEQLERRVIGDSSRVTVINPVIASSIVDRHPDARHRIEVLEQGFDPEDYPPAAVPDREGPLTMVYTGVFYDAQTPAVFLEGLARFRAAHPDTPATAEFVGLFPQTEMDRIERLKLSDVVTVRPYAPHREAMARVAAADVPWLVVGRREGAEQISTGKLYAYAGAGKPILALVPDGAARAALERYGAAYFADPDDASSVAEAIARLAADKKSGSFPRASAEFVSQHDRRRLAGRLAAILDAVVK